jgi:phospholipid/cholesterol/gamma-HCH transport system permease protein
MREAIATLRDAVALFKRCLVLALRGTCRWDEFTHAFVQIGVDSLPIITVSTAFSGMVVTDEMAYHMRSALSNISIVPGLTGQFILRELGIAVPALLLVSKVGASMTAEVGTMRITEQIDALRLLRVDPVAYLVLPRWLASIVATVCLTVIAIMTTLLFSTTVAVFKYGFSYAEYVNMFRHFVTLWDVICAIAKSIVFGAVIPILACAYGFRCRGGAQGVGQTTTDAVVASTLAVIVLDFLVTYAFTLIL